MPSKRVITSTIIAILIVSVGFLLVRSDGQYDKEAELGNLTVSDSFYASGSDDSDGDGLKDWEEVLWDTYIDNPDSDGDGVSDGKEVSSGTHPKIPAPGDALTQEHVARVEAQIALQDILAVNQTDSVFDRILPSALVQADENITGNIGDDSDFYDLESISTAVANELASSAPTYGLSDIKVSNDTSDNAHISYIINLLEVAANNSNDQIEPELEIIGEAVGNENYSSLSKLNLNIAAYTGIKIDLLSLEVPSSLSGVHLEMLNNYNNIILSLQEMQKIETDPLLGSVGIERYREYTAKNNEIFINLGANLRELQN